MKQKNNYTGEDFTFVVCAYKECPYLEEAIRSIIKQTEKCKILISTSTPNEYIEGIARKYDIEMRVNPDGGQIKDYNFALAQVDTDLVMLAHQDEILSECFAQRVLEEINKEERPIIAFTNYLEIHDDIIDKKPSTMVKIKRIMLFPLCFRALRSTWFGKRLIQCFGDPITHPTVVCVKKELPDVVFREEYKAAMDWDLWERLSRQEGSFVYVKDVLLYHRMNDMNQTVHLIKSSNVRYENELEILSRFWKKPIARLIMNFYKHSVDYY